ncbi:MAG: hypothetical protein C0444_06445 [Microbacterium sp.]|nr:hypothetical protein [Microbacterium sp.]MBA4345121.1 hypothetical protein [Microbacterium sp.]
MTSRAITLLTPAAILLSAALLAGCSAPAADGSGTTGESTGTGAEAPAPADGGSDLGLPGQTVGADTDCSFLADDQVAAIWGFDVVDLDISMVIEAGGVGGILYGCDYNQSDDGTGLTVGVDIREYVSPDGPTRYFADALSGAEFDGEGGQLIEPVSGVGEEAGILTKAELVGTPQNLSELLIVRNGNLLIEVSITDIINGVKPEYRDLLVDTYEAVVGG